MKKIKTRASKPKTAASPIPKSAIEKMEDLKARLQEAEETIEAIRSGAVDALVVSTPEGEQIFTLRGAEYPYRVFFETMNQGGTVITPEGLILACNKSFEHMVGVNSARLCGSSFYDFIPSKERTKISRFVKGINETETQQDLRGETELLASGGEKLPVKLALSAVNERKKTFICGVITDLSDQKCTEEILRRAHDELELKVGERTLELEESKVELEFQNEELHSMREKLENYAAELERS
ncbi:MAG: PAS domain S-box protein, partial [Pseudomonadota bacterium]